MSSFCMHTVENDTVENLNIDIFATYRFEKRRLFSFRACTLEVSLNFQLTTKVFSPFPSLIRYL